uniref:Uncharacterized protein n=1 Tax=Panagrolaimus davidi TaxID=227884 RepID=A0A914QD49_9BILA
MATKIDCFFLNDNQESVSVDNSQTFHDNQYSNFNLNQNLKWTAATLKPPGSPVSDNTEGRKNPSHLNKPSKISNFSKLINDKTENEEFKKPWKKDSYLNTINGNNLSLHIAAYENSIETHSFNGSRNEDLQKGKSDLIKNEKQIFTAETFGIQNSFEFPRQENEGAKVPEVSNFKASQRLLNPNKASKNGKKICFYFSSYKINST